MKLLLLHGHDAVPGDLLHVAEAVRSTQSGIDVTLLTGPVRLPNGRFAWWSDDNGPSAGVALVAEHADIGPIVVAGFSQGGAVALAAANLGGVIGAASIGGFAIEPLELSADTAPLFVAHGRDDVVVDVFHAEFVARRASRAKAAHTLALHDGGHEWPGETTDAFVSWLEETVRRR